VKQNTLDRLFVELELRLKQRLADIEQSYRSRAQRLEQDRNSGAETQIAKLQQNHKRRLRQLSTRFLREAGTKKQQQLWTCQRECLEQLLADARDTLGREPLDGARLSAWLTTAQRGLGQPQVLRLKLKPEWAESMGEGVIPVIPMPMLGGAVLEDTEHHIEVDGSWDRRLEDLVPQLWQRWLQHVGTDNQD
jgi:vacuolar-type H+-ATPase subunit E/Vma4